MPATHTALVHLSLCQQFLHPQIIPLPTPPPYCDLKPSVLPLPLQLISLRQHLLHTCLESEYLTRLYKHQLVQLDYEECHAHLRCINFDLTLRFPTDKKLDQFITQARDEVKGGNPRLDHYTPTKIKLAIHELDDKSVSGFSFKTKSDVLKVLHGYIITILLAVAGLLTKSGHSKIQTP